MKQGELILRDAGKDELYWIVLILLAGLAWTKTESLLPEQVTGDALIALIEQTITELGATSKKDMGRVMGALTKATGGNFDKPMAAKEVGARLI